MSETDIQRRDWRREGGGGGEKKVDTPTERNCVHEDEPAMHRLPRCALSFPGGWMMDHNTIPNVLLLFPGGMSHAAVSGNR